MGGKKKNNNDKNDINNLPVFNHRPDLVEYAKSLHMESSEGKEYSLQELFAHAVDMESYLRDFAQVTKVRMTLHAGEAAKALGEKAAKGDVGAARLLFDIIGVTPKGKSSQPVNVFNKINISPSEKEALIKDLGDDFIDV